MAGVTEIEEEAAEASVNNDPALRSSDWKRIFEPAERYGKGHDKGQLS